VHLSQQCRKYCRYRIPTDHAHCSYCRSSKFWTMFHTYLIHFVLHVSLFTLLCCFIMCKTIFNPFLTFCWPCCISVYLSQYLTNLMHKIFFHNKFYFMPLQVSSTCAHHQEVKIALHSLWYHHSYRFDDTRGCVMQFWPPDDEHMCSKHVEAWNETYCETNFVHQVG